MNKNKENYFIDFLRFIFSISILIYHGRFFSSNVDNALLKYGNLAVDFYFIVTGYLMINSINKKKNNNNSSLIKETISFVYGKIKRIFPALVLTFFVGIIFVYGKSFFLNPSLLIIKKVLPELFQLGVFGYELTINCSWWYISSMLFVLLLLYPLARKFKSNYYKYIVPVIIIATFFLAFVVGMDIDSPLDKQFFLINGFYKALIFIPLGNICFILAQKISEYKFSKRQFILLSVLEIVIYILIILNLQYLFIPKPIHAYLLMINVALTFSNSTYTSKLFKSSKWKKLGKYGFYIYLINTSIRIFTFDKFAHYGFTYIQLLIIFVSMTCFIAFIIYIIIEVLYKKIKNNIVKES